MFKDFLCVCACVHASHMCALRGQKRTLELQVGTSCPMHVMGTELEPQEEHQLLLTAEHFSGLCSLDFCMRTAQLVPAEVTVQERKQPNMARLD